MFPGLGNMDPKRMKTMLQQLGIKTEEISAEKVIIESKDKKIVIENPSITITKVQGKSVYTIMGKATDQINPEIPESDIALVAEQAKTTKQEALEALKETKGDIAEAIQKIMEKRQKLL